MYEERVRRVLDAMTDRNLTQMLVSDPYSIYYLTGVDVAPDERLYVLYLRQGRAPRLFLNRLFAANARNDVDTVWITDDGRPLDAVIAAVDPTWDLGIDQAWPARFLLPLMEELRNTNCILASDCVDAARGRKDEHERQLMRAASEINDRTMERVAAYIKEGMTEKQVVAFVNQCYEEEGCEGPSFDGIVAFGPNAADPHHIPDNTVLKAGDCIVVDIGCRKDHYCSDMTRTFFCAYVPPDHADIYDLVREANEAAERLVRPGVPLRKLDATARNLIASGGCGDAFTHRLGHTIGQTCHEGGHVSADTDVIAAPGMIFSIEPGIYLWEEMGVRIEDLVLVTESGCEVLNRVDKSLRVL